MNYTINRKLGSCEINVLKEGLGVQDIIVDGNLLALKNSSSFFDFDGIPYQYVGLVWILLIIIAKLSLELYLNYFKEKSRWS